MQRVMAAAGRAAGTVQCSHSTHAGILTAAAALKEADAILVTTGAGFGCGFRAPRLSWEQRVLESIPTHAAPRTRGSRTAPTLAGSRASQRSLGASTATGSGLYRKTVPHDGFHILQRWIANCSHGGFCIHLQRRWAAAKGWVWRRRCCGMPRIHRPHAVHPWVCGARSRPIHRTSSPGSIRIPSGRIRKPSCCALLGVARLHGPIF